MSDPKTWPIVTAQIETAMYSGTSPHPVVFGIPSNDTFIGGDGRQVGYLSGAERAPDSDVWRDRNGGQVPMTRLWLRLDPAAIATLPGVREAVLAIASSEEGV